MPYLFDLFVYRVELTTQLVCRQFPANDRESLQIISTASKPHNPNDGIQQPRHALRRIRDPRYIFVGIQGCQALYRRHNGHHVIASN
jgi:hypothetical protein